MLFHIDNYLQFIFYLNVRTSTTTANIANNEYQNRK
jgi:hypothetical protein